MTSFSPASVSRAASSFGDSQGSQNEMAELIRSVRTEDASRLCLDSSRGDTGMITTEEMVVDQYCRVVRTIRRAWEMLSDRPGPAK